MAAPQRGYRSTLPTEPAWPVRKRGPDRGPKGAVGRKAAEQRRRFAVLVVVPVLLMLGSVYLHTVAAGLEEKVAGLEQSLDAARAKGERLDVRVAELSRAERIRPLATEKLGMRDPGSQDLRVYGSEGEDGTQNRGEEEGGRPRR
jgi:cell division protein FtsL